MIKRKTGFTLVEMLLVIGILGLVLAASSDMFVKLLNEYKQQSKIAETNVEGIIGLELMRQDIERAGYGLPWVMGGLTYNEASNAPGNGYNDSTANPPRPIVSGNDVSENGTDFIDSDYLVIKATNISRNASAQRWTHLTTTSGAKVWDVPAGMPSDNPATTDNVIVLSPGAVVADERTLLQMGIFDSAHSVSWRPAAEDPQPRFVYGISDSAPRMPFNRADYYVTKDRVNVPNRCAPNTGVLVKSTISHANGNLADHLPLLDCVANMQVVFRLDTNADGAVDLPTDDISTLSAEQIRTQVREVRVYILAHEGQTDNSFTYRNSSSMAGCTSPTQIYVGDPAIGMGGCFDIGTNVHYRWKVYVIAVYPKNMRQ